MDPEEEQIEFKKQSVSLTLGSILAAAINGVVGYIAVYFFKPLWEKIINWWNNETKR